MIQGFKKFIMQGNVIDLAVAVVIGAAFSAVVDGLVKGIIDPLIAGIANTEGLEGAVWTVPGTTIAFGWGLVLSALIHFLAVALVVYLAFVVPMNKFKERQAAKAGLPEDVPAPTETELLVEIRDLLAKQNRA